MENRELKERVTQLEYDKFQLESDLECTSEVVND